MSKSFVVESSALERPDAVHALVEQKDEKGRVKRKVRMSLDEAKEYRQASTFVTAQFNSAPSNLLTLASGGHYRDIIPKSTIGVIKGGMLRMNVTVSSSSARLAPTPFWFSRIEVWVGPKQLTVMYSESMMAAIGSLPRGKRANVLKMCGMDEKYAPLQTLASGTTATYWLPLIGGIFNHDIIPSSFDGDMFLDFYPAGDARVSGSGTVTLNSISLVAETENWNQGMLEYHRGVRQKVAVQENFLEPVWQSFTSQTLTAGQNTQLVLTSLQGYFCDLLVIIRPTSTSNTGNTKFISTVSLGAGGLLDVTDSGNSSLLGGGSALTSDFDAFLASALQTDGDFNAAFKYYKLPFCENSQKAAAGIVNGYHHFKDGRDKISLTPASAGTAEVHTITYSASMAGGSGNYQLYFKGQFTAVLAFSANVAAIKAALEALDCLLYAPGGPITVTASNALNSGATTMTITFSANFSEIYAGNTDVVQLLQQGLLTSAPAAISNSSAISTSGVSGFTTGTYNIDVFGMRLRRTINYQRKYESEDWSPLD